MPKANTIFSYFTKKSNASSVTDASDEHGKNVLTPTKSRNSPVKSGKSKTVKQKENGASPACKNDTEASGVPANVGDIMWAKLDGYPWWPSLVCNHPTQNTHLKTGKKTLIHVQFFDDPPSRAWINAKFVKPFSGSESKDFQRGGAYYSSDIQCWKGAKQADKALETTVDERMKLVVELQPSSDEDDTNNEEAMELDDINFDDDIFDNEAGSSEADNSKENYEDEEMKDNSAKKKTPQKSSAKQTRSGRSTNTKRRKIVVESDDEDSGEEFAPESEESEDDATSGIDEDEISVLYSESEADSPIKKTVSRKRKRNSPVKKTMTPSRAKESLKEFSTPSNASPAATTSCSKQFTPTVGQKTKSILSGFSAPDTPRSSSPATTEEGRTFFHQTLDWLRPENIRDGKKNSKSNPEYDPRTLYVPDAFLKNCTPAMRQWWDLKSKHFDTALFFKMGKFYELYHMDADIAVKELGVIYMKGDVAHSGFPEIAYGRYSETLVQKGYKVARVEQTETPDMMDKRCKSLSKPTKFDKVVKRELCRVTTPGTRVYSFIDGDSSDAQNNYLLAVKEKENENSSIYGVCFIDTSIGKFHIGQFDDDRHGSRFRTLLAHYSPAQILYERGKMSSRTAQVINTNLLSVLKEQLSPNTEFWDGTKTLKYLLEEEYFLDDKEKTFEWPAALKAMISETDSLGQTASDGCELAISALGALIWYLKDCLMEHELLSMKSFEEYKPMDGLMETIQDQTPDFTTGRQHMVLDGVTLANLDILENSTTGTLEGTLLEKLDQCSTPFGKRLFRQWLCAPLCNPNSINDRLDAVEDLMSVPEVVADVVDLLCKLPDLERLLSKIHTLGSAARLKNHPDSRAILYEEVQYSKKKIEDFFSTLSGFKTSSKIMKEFQDSVPKFKSKLLKQAVSVRKEDNSNGGWFPNLDDELSYFDHAFDQKKAREAGAIIPAKGYVTDYDNAIIALSCVKDEFNRYLEKQKQRLGCRNITYWGTGKSRFQLEVPDSIKSVPDEYDITSQKKGYRRYRTKEILRLLGKIEEVEAKRDAALKDTMRMIFHSFDEHYAMWSSAVQCLSVLDVLISLSRYSKCGDGVMCRPELVVPGNNSQPFLEIREARHPCISQTFSGGDFIPNDTVIGITDESNMETESGNDHASVVLVTGPNMGGKSTLMRQVGVIVIMSQLGCYVPAEVCRLTPVDRVFTRLGASDRIMAGESTFFVELSETSAILQHATKHSLVLLDELGRGTATYDGTAIACAVVQELSQNKSCRTLFSTHYHSLVEEFCHDPNIRLGHMACMVENENDDDPSQETITFLYKFIQGACPKSYGFNAARLADLPEEIIKIAQAKAHQFEQGTENLKFFRKLFEKNITVEQLRTLQQLIMVS